MTDTLLIDDSPPSQEQLNTDLKGDHDSTEKNKADANIEKKADENTEKKADANTEKKADANTEKKAEKNVDKDLNEMEALLAKGPPVVDVKAVDMDMDYMMQQLHECIVKNEVSARASIGQAFKSWLIKNPDQKASYESIKGAGKTHTLKNEFRVAWAKDQLEERAAGKRKTKEWQKVSMDEGCYESLERIIFLEGGRRSPQAVRAAVNYVTKAFAMGGDWINFNSMTGRTDILYIKKKKMSIFTTKWELFEEHRSANVNTLAPKLDIDASASTGTPASTDPNTPPPKRRKTAPPSATKNTEPTPVDDKAKMAKKVKVDILRVANATKQKFLKCKAVHDTIMNNIVNDENYAWARTEFTKGKLESSYKEVSDKLQKDSFYKSFIVNELAEIKKKHDENVIVDKLKEFAADLDQSLKGLEREQLRFSRMHAARDD